MALLSSSPGTGPEAAAAAGTTAPPSVTRGATNAADPHVAYLVLRFPTLSETFIVREIIALRKRGWDIPIYPLWLDRPAKVHDEVRALLPSVRWTHPLSCAVLLANLRMLSHRPRMVLSTLGLIARDVMRQPKRGLKSLALFPIMVWIATDLERRGIRHIHAHFASYPALAALVAHRLSGMTWSFTGHAYDLYVAPQLLPEKVASASFVVTISEYNRQLLRRIAGSDTPIHVVHCGVDVPDALPRLHGGNEIVCVARLEEKKGHRYLIDACRILHARGVDFRCTIVGGGPLMADLQQRVNSAGLGERVILAGPGTSAEVRAALERASIFVLPSVVMTDGNAEGIPVALMEAIAAGVPVVSTRITGIPELIEDGVGGLLAPERDPAALADAIEGLLRDADLRERLRTAAFARLAAAFRLEDSAAAMDALLRYAAGIRACSSTNRAMPG